MGRSARSLVALLALVAISCGGPSAEPLWSAINGVGQANYIPADSAGDLLAASKAVVTAIPVGIRPGWTYEDSKFEPLAVHILEFEVTSVLHGELQTERFGIPMPIADVDRAEEALVQGAPEHLVFLFSPSESPGPAGSVAAEDGLPLYASHIEGMLVFEQGRPIAVMDPLLDTGGSRVLAELDAVGSFRSMRDMVATLKPAPGILTGALTQPLAISQESDPPQDERRATPAEEELISQETPITRDGG